jgi:hypothetical protein
MRLLVNSGASRATRRQQPHLKNRAQADWSLMKLLILAPLAAAVVCSIMWYEAKERKLSGAQKSAFGLTAIVTWIIVLIVGNFVS